MIILGLRNKYKLKDILSAVDFPKSTFEYWQRKLKETNPDQEIINKIIEIRQTNPDYGYRRLTAELRRKLSKPINKKKVQRIIQENNLQVTTYGYGKKTNKNKGKFNKRTKDDLINQDFTADQPYEKITTDTTEFTYYTFNEYMNIQVNKLYLDPYLDMFNREIISYKITDQPNKETMISALQEAVRVIKEGNKGLRKENKTIIHSDRGWAYHMIKYQAILEGNDILQSMSGKGNCYDNAVIESFFGTLKQKIYKNDKTYYSRESLVKAIEAFIEYYNTKRIKENLGYLSPVEYRLEKAA